MLLYSDFKKPFDSATGASFLGIGAVLSQYGRPITMFSRTVKDRYRNSILFGLSKVLEITSKGLKI